MGGMMPMNNMGSMGGMSQDMSPEAFQQARAQRIQYILQSIDTNRNGMIDPEEVQGPNGLLVQNILRRAGVAPNYPMPLSTVQEALNNRTRGGMRGNPSSTGNQTPASTSSSDKSSEESKSASAAGGSRLVPGFDVALAKQPTVLGFGVPSANSTANAKNSGASSDSSSSTSSTSATSTASAAQLDERIRKYAQSLLKQYDKNKNGQLEKEEWQEIKGNIKSADKNGDGVITLDELTEWLAADSQRGPKQNSGEAIASAASSSSSSSGSKSAALQSKSGKSKPHRFRSPTERLPEGLPDWFARKDADGDGQVSMSEYLNGDWTETKAKEFSRYDLNDDGVITPQECLKVDKKK